MPRPEEPTWHPISALPMAGLVMTGMLESAEDQAIESLVAKSDPEVGLEELLRRGSSLGS